MMNVKKYRAATTREALEKIKQDLGEEAFVLETKRVRTGGFLGLRTEMQIEVSAAAPAAMVKPVVESRAKTSFASNRILNLTDDTIAAPAVSRNHQDGKEEIMAMIAKRTALSNGFEKEVPQKPEILREAFDFEQKEIEAVEITTEAPRVVHPKKEILKQTVSESNIVSAKPSENWNSLSSNRDLELLRAELREVKFSLGAFTNRQNVQTWQSDVDLDLFGEIFDSPFYEVYIELIGTGLSQEMARRFVADIIPHYKNDSIAPNNLPQKTLLRAVSSMLKFEPDALQSAGPSVMAVIGPTGVGKTTTIAKLAARAALHERRRVELVTLDTYRIAAVEQLKTYAEIIGAGCHVVRSVLELDAVLRRMPDDALVLIDTTGKSPHDLADQFELSDYLRQRPEIRKYLTVQATTHPVDTAAAVKKFEMYGADCLVLTKLDETMRPGAVIEVAAESALPLAYFCMGQRVPEDLQIATAETLTARLLGQKV